MCDISTRGDCRRRGRAQLGVAVAAAAPDAADLRAEVVVGRARAERPAQVAPGAREEAGVEPAVGRQPGAGAVAAEGLGDRRDHADLAAAVDVAVAVGHLARVGGLDRLERPLGVDRGSRISAAGTTSSSRQPLLVPTSMYSIRRRTWPVPRKCSAMSRMLSSLSPRLTTMLTLTGPSPARAAASMPSSTCGDREADVVHRGEHVVVERVEADRDPVAARRRRAAARSAPGARRSSSSPCRRCRSTRRRAWRPAGRGRDAGAARRRSGGACARRRRRTAAPAARSLRTSGAGSGAGTGSRGRKPPSACSRRSGSCSGR